MTDHEGTTTQAMNNRPLRERIGVSISAPDAPTLLNVIAEAEAAGVTQLWMTQGPATPDSLTVYGAALGRTSRVRLGTSIVPSYPRHPLALAQQAATVDSLGPGRLRLGVGPSHRPVIEGTYGLRMESPMEHLREYIGVLRAALWEGQVDHQGRFFTAKAKMTSTPRVPLLVSALSKEAYHLAGQISDGAISWNCPPLYLTEVAVPALRAGAEAVGRPAPPLVAHVWIALSTDTEAVRAAARQRLALYARLPFYVKMFASAGFPVQPDGTLSDALIDALVIRGDAEAVAARLRALLASGFDELLLTGIELGDASAERTELFRLISQLI